MSARTRIRTRTPDGRKATATRASLPHPARRPKRIQRKRVKGWTMPRGAVYVGRGSRFGNGWIIGEPHPDTGAPITREDAFTLYAASLAGASRASTAIIQKHLAGRDLACYCRLDQRCHADLLLVVANDPDPIESGDLFAPENADEAAPRDRDDADPLTDALRTAARPAAPKEARA